jgi:RNA polymerase sigma factor (sigma-70 family)
MRFEEELVELLPRLRRFARGLARDASDADDLCQAAIERALKSREQWQQGTRLDSWMYRITRNLWIDERRAAGRRGAHTPYDDAVTQVTGDGAAEVEAGAVRGDVDGAMARLPDEQREVVMLVLVEGYGYREAAALLEMPIGTVTSRLARGRDTLMHLLGEAA